MNRPLTETAYQERINRVLMHIDRHLGEELKLQDLAAIAHFSPYHFHKIMWAYLRESLGSYIIRVRLDTAASLLYYSVTAISDIAYRIGYETPAAFTKAFQKRFGTSPSDYRQNKGSLVTKKVQISNLKFQTMDLKPKIREINPIPVVYVHCIGAYNNVGPEHGEPVTFSQGLIFVVTTINGLISALVVTNLAITKPGESPAIVRDIVRKNGTPNPWPTILTGGYIAIWLIVGLAALVIGVMIYPDVNATLKDLGTTWLGLAVAAGYSYFGVTPK